MQKMKVCLSLICSKITCLIEFSTSISITFLRLLRLKRNSICISLEATSKPTIATSQQTPSSTSFKTNDVYSSPSAVSSSTALNKSPVPLLWTSSWISSNYPSPRNCWSIPRYAKSWELGAWTCAACFGTNSRILIKIYSQLRSLRVSTSYILSMTRSSFGRIFHSSANNCSLKLSITRSLFHLSLDHSTPMAFRFSLWSLHCSYLTS